MEKKDLNVPRLYYGSFSRLSGDDCRDVNPFNHDLNLTKLDYVVSFVLGIILVPIRLILVGIIILIGWIGAAIFTSDALKNREGIPNSKLRLKCYEILLKLLGLACGFIVTVEGEEASKEECPIFVAASHSSFFDAIVIPHLKMPVVLSREENKHIPLLGTILILGQCIFLKREDTQSKQMAAQGIDDWLDITTRAGSPSKTDQKLLIFPEGFNSNRKALLPFKTGAFRSGKPVQPVLVKYPNRLDTVTWTWDQPHGAATVALLTLSRPFTRLSIQILPVYHPNEAERSDAKLYADNVRRLMSSALNIPACRLTSADVQDLRMDILEMRRKKKN